MARYGPFLSPRLHHQGKKARVKHKSKCKGDRNAGVPLPVPRDRRWFHACRANCRPAVHQDPRSRHPGVARGRQGSPGVATAGRCSPCSSPPPLPLRAGPASLPTSFHAAAAARVEWCGRGLQPPPERTHGCRVPSRRTRLALRSACTWGGLSRAGGLAAEEAGCSPSFCWRARGGEDGDLRTWRRVGRSGQDCASFPG